MKNKFLFAIPFVVLLCFSWVAYVPDDLMDTDLFPNSILPLGTLFGIGLLAFICGCAFGVVLAIRRKQPKWYYLPIGCILAVAVSIFIATLPVIEIGMTKAKTGVVLDAATGKPIADAYVVARWYDKNGLRFFIGPSGGGGTACLHRAVVKTDAEGRYSISSTAGEFDVTHAPSIKFYHRYYWGLGVYAPGYEGPDFKDRKLRNIHPSVRWDSFGWTQHLLPVAMTKATGEAGHRAYYIVLTQQRLACNHATNQPLSFTGELYREAYPLVCEQGGLDSARSLAELRMDAWPVMPEMPRYIKKPLQQILKRYYWTAPLSQGDAKQVCALLKQTNEAQQP